MALLAAALVLYPTSAARAIIGGGGDPEWHGSHSKPLVIYGNDPLGSTRVVIDAEGDTIETRDYAPFGKTVAWQDPYDLKHRFTSQPYDDGVELYNYGARMYEPRWGRFVSPDELVEGFDSQGLNGYAYVRNAPVSRVDPTGEASIGISVPVDTWNTGGGRWSPTHQADIAARVVYSSRASSRNSARAPRPLTAFTASRSLGDAAVASNGRAYRGYEKGEEPRPPILLYIVGAAAGAPEPALTKVAAVALLTGLTLIYLYQLFGPQIFLESEADPPPADGDRNPAQDKKLTPGEVAALGKKVDIHDLKGGKGTGKLDLYKDGAGNIYIKPKGGSGPGEPTGLNIKDFM